jgi:hypothetical protein
MTDLDRQIDADFTRWAAEMVSLPPEKLSRALGDLCVLGLTFETTRENRIKKIKMMLYTVLMQMR